MTEHKRIILKFIKANRNLYDSEIAKKIKAKHYELFLVMQFTSLRRRISEMRQEFNLYADTIDLQEYFEDIKKTIRKYPNHTRVALALILSKKYNYTIAKIEMDINTITHFGDDYKNKTRSKKRKHNVRTLPENSGDNRTS